MTAKKITTIILVSIAVGLVLFALMLYFTIKTKSTSLNDIEPFRSLIDKTMVLQRQTFLFSEPHEIYSDSDAGYPYFLLDSLHPNWQWVQDRLKMSEPDVKQIRAFPAGTKLTIKKAVMYTNGVSGGSNPSLFGIIKDEENTYKIQYRWGEQSKIRYFDNIAESWKFSKAPWQKVEDTTYYALPEAKW